MLYACLLYTGFFLFLSYKCTSAIAASLCITETKCQFVYCFSFRFLKVGA